MKKLIILVLCLMLFVGACGTNSKQSHSSSKGDKGASHQTYTSDNGDKVKVPTDPQRIVVLHPTYVGALVKFGHKPVAVPKFVEQNKVLNEATKGIKRIDNTNVEAVVKEKPDLIITTVEDKNLKKLKKVAPTVTFDAQKSTYKDNTKNLAKLVGEEQKADKWLKDWDAQLAKDKKELEPFIKGKTASVVQETPKGIMAFSDHLGRGTEIIYEGYGLKQPDKLAEATKTKFATPLKPELFHDYIGDIAVIAQQGDHQPSFENTNYWQNLDAVKNHRVIEFDVSETQYNDPISLEKQREIFYKALKEMAEK
ncbi:ABC transporter substrate-binding protein [Staphylococcus pettenkoferi]|uniref:ABC transporter substrate-binding protein n=1 Tax=Staphylococcus pettenkoferi TaxID=170573 RepID=UPI002274DD06|nr:ABC transporter substrate-binding protein [Staphylococcus pettenkoferi]MCY1573210.1 ABC transporter substrate-binding protein [Staphylococcus pettenkoferi]MCY1579373.1 ABC transporter substrate-binding protein [Staphylococcus pettenkoferi]